MAGAIDKRRDPLTLTSRLDSLAVAAELFDHGPSAICEGLEIVATLQDGNDFAVTVLRRQGDHPARHRREPVFTDPHAAKGVAMMAIETRRDQNKLGLELTCD